jgi:hypothetical protein
MGVRAKEDGESESRLVMGRIGVALPGKITPRENGQTSIRSFPTREPELPTSGTKQLTAVETQAGAVPHEQIERNRMHGGVGGRGCKVPSYPDQHDPEGTS